MREGEQSGDYSSNIVTMIVFFVVIIVLILFGCKYSYFHDDYMGRVATISVKGIFAMIILLSHMRGYITIETMPDRLYETVLNFIGQLMVALYFFYSGYGIIESYKNKPSYVSSFPKNRILKTFIHFDMAVFLFFIYSLISSQTYPQVNYFLCWVGWESIGNSNWFVFDILLLYIFSYVSMKLGKTGGVKLVIAIVFLLTVLLWTLLYISHRGSWWYSTLLCFPLGIIYSYMKSGIDQGIKRNIWNYHLSLAVLTIIFVVCRMFRNSLTISIEACVFCLIVTLFTMKISIGNKILYWIGVNAFSIYILQRLPMMFFANIGLNENNMLYALAVIPTVMIIACGFTQITERIDMNFLRIDNDRNEHKISH